MLEFYVDYSREHLEAKDYLSVAMLLKNLKEHSTEDYEDTLEFIDFYDPSAINRVNEALDAHLSRLHRRKAK